MKKLLLSTFVMLISTTLFPQKIVFEKKYSELPFELVIENSGIYSIASFDIQDDIISLSSFTDKGIFDFKDNLFVKYKESVSPGSDFTTMEASEKLLQKNNSELKENRLNVRYKKNYFGESNILQEDDGVLTGKNGNRFIIKVPDRNRLIIEQNILGNNNFEFHFSSDLACADLIGIDKSGNIFLVVEKYLSDIPLKIERNVIVINKSGEIITTLLLPNIKYLFTIKDLQIDKKGNLYHLISFPDRVEIVKWSNLTKSVKGIIKYPKEYNKEIHFNNFVTTSEIETKKLSLLNKIESGVSRTEALKIADTYVLHQYECTSANLASTDTKAPDGDIVRTPEWLIVGMNARIPYKWGGFNTIAQFDDGLANGKYAGDINTNGVSSYAVGVDCSGYVSRCWQLSYHASTAYMPNITTQYGSWDDLKPGDAVHKIGHVRLFVKRNINGTLKIVESTGRGWGVSYYTYSLSDLSAYTPRYYNGMESNYNTQQPVLLSSEAVSVNTALLKWKCDSENIIGYRIYASADGVSWNKIADENTVTTNYAEVGFNGDVSYFRVSSVKNDSPDFSESNWSNVLGLSNFNSEQTVLIVDGFNREDGSWRGAGHSFVLKYGKALEKLSLSFISVRNSEIENGNINLSDYDFVFWISGDESTVDETFNSIEQGLLKSYLENGGSFFVSGSEIGWDLDNKGTEKDKEFYHNYLKAKYISDEAGYSTAAVGIENTAMSGCNIKFGQTYEEDYPDEIAVMNGSTLCMKYLNYKGAGVQFSGYFGNSTIKGNLIYLGFPIETTANDDSFSQIIYGAVKFFKANPTSVVKFFNTRMEYKLEQNYPNPFNPTTTVTFTLPAESKVKIEIFNSLGQKVGALVNDILTAGNYSRKWDAGNLPSGIYFMRIDAEGINSENSFTKVRKAILLK